MDGKWSKEEEPKPLQKTGQASRLIGSQNRIINIILDDTNLVGHIKRIVICSQSNVSLLTSVRPDQRVDLLRLNVVHLLHGLLDLLLVRAHVHDEHQRVVVLNLLHGGLRGERVFEHLVVVELAAAGRTQARVLGRPRALQRLRAMERHGRSHLAPQLLHGLRGSLQSLRSLRRLGRRRRRLGHLRRWRSHL